MTEFETWRNEYVGKLAAPHGWWASTALAWLEPGDSLLGSEAGAAAPLPERLPARAATLRLDGDELTLSPLTQGLFVRGRSLTEPLAQPLTITGDQTLYVGEGEDAVRVNLIRRGGLFGVRVYDPAAAAAHDPSTDVAWFEFDPCWRFTADFIEPEPGETVDVINVLGQAKETPVAGRARFTFEGREHTLLATASGRPGRLFFNFRDATNGATSYGGGRFLNVDGPVDGRIVLDFNYAHHPPCAHTPYATCPTPSAENRLPFAVLAGERSAERATSGVSARR